MSDLITVNLSSYNNTYTVSVNDGVFPYASDVRGLSANWENTYNTVQSKSVNWDITTENVNNNASSWQSGYDYLTANGSIWTNTTETVNNNSSYWNRVSNIFSSNTINLNPIITDTNPGTDTGEYLVININGNARKILLYS